MAKVTITSISIENLGPFRDRQTLDFSVKDSRPVILVKALNGSGKTTLLTALQIGLYGQRAISQSRRQHYEQLVTSLQRKDAQSAASVEIAISIETGGVQQALVVRREWSKHGGSFSEDCVVYREGAQDFELTSTWGEYIEGILPAELVQLFLFDGEKIESLANPERLPDLLRRATEVFLGIGGIDSLANDLKAVERRTLLRNKENSDGFEDAKAALLSLEQQSQKLAETISLKTQELATTRNTLDQAQSDLDKYVEQAKRNGLVAYQEASDLRGQAVQAQASLKAAREALTDALSHPLLPIAWAPTLWEKYQSRWNAEQYAVQARYLVDEIRKRDKRVLHELPSNIPASAAAKFKRLLQDDLAQNFQLPKDKLQLQPAAAPSEHTKEVNAAMQLVRDKIKEVEAATNTLEKAEKRIGEIPADEQLGGLVSGLGGKSKVVAEAEALLAAVGVSLEETKAQLTHVEIKLNLARGRLGAEYKERSMETKSLSAAERAKQTLAIFKERLLASKANWLSDMITTEFRNLLRKKNLVARVIVNPETYQVSIEDTKRHELPMDRLSAGERQLLAISVLSALIKERKGRFPVVVDTPLARLDRHHRESLIRRFFSTVSHQVMVLSTDEEVEGSVYTALKPYMSNEYVLEFDDATRCTTATKTGALPVLAEVA